MLHKSRLKKIKCIEINGKFYDVTDVPEGSIPAQFTVTDQLVQEDVPLSEDEEAAVRAEWAANEAVKKRELKVSAIRGLEGDITQRMIRDALLGSIEIDPRTGRTAREQIAYIDEKIVVLRQQLRDMP